MCGAATHSRGCAHRDQKLRQRGVPCERCGRRLGSQLRRSGLRGCGAVAHAAALHQLTPLERPAASQRRRLLRIRLRLRRDRRGGGAALAQQLCRQTAIVCAAHHAIHGQRWRRNGALQRRADTHTPA
jgi:hypothetical protein